MKSKFNLSDEKKKACILLIQEYFLQERDEDLGYLAADLILNFFLDKLAPEFYNQGIDDAYKYMNDRIEDILSLYK
ncbi:MAG: DUF2164 family protein [Methylocystaceae bacterium]